MSNLGDRFKLETVEVEASPEAFADIEILPFGAPPVIASSNPYIAINGKRFPAEGLAAGLEGDTYRGKIAVSPEVAREIQDWIDSGHQIITVPSYPTCPDCGATGDDDWDYCPHDGGRLDPAGEPVRYEVDRYGKRVEPGESDVN